ncbi:uncharacterized protein [Haliotis cracherodii]|uniref:uncharacterized protein n=1 Tax=Haliotis cracherodii TaxID=6455 RepID=UPI0039ED7E48
MSSCTRCNNVVTKYRAQSTDNELLSIHTERAIYLKKSQERNKTRDELLKRLSALRNSGGGVLLIHVNGTRAGDRCLKYFDEFVGSIVTRLLEPGEVYANTYKRQWLQDILEYCADSAVFIHIRVAAVTAVTDVKGVATVDFNTKLGKDYENVIPTTQQLLTVRSHRRTSTGPAITGLTDDSKLHEDVHIQLKRFLPKPQSSDEIQQDATTFVEYLWNQLKLKDSITSMSKIPDGGSYYLGIGERVNTSEDGTYTTVIPDVRGFELKLDQGELEETLKSKLRDCVLLGRSENTFTDVPSDLIAIAFHPIPSDHQRCVLRVAVKCVEGVVFCDRCGPRTYMMENGQICRMEKGMWLERIM